MTLNPLPEKPKECLIFQYATTLAKAPTSVMPVVVRSFPFVEVIPTDTAVETTILSAYDLLTPRPSVEFESLLMVAPLPNIGEDAGSFNTTISHAYVPVSNPREQISKAVDKLSRLGTGGGILGRLKASMLLDHSSTTSVARAFERAISLSMLTQVNTWIYI